MAKNNGTVFQRLGSVLLNQEVPVEIAPKNVASYTLNGPVDDIVYQTNNKADYDTKVREIQQGRLLAHQWIKAGVDTAIEQMNDITNVKLMYRDADLMAQWPEIGSALEVLSEEACNVNAQGRILNIYSNSKRIKSVLEDLFINRLKIHETLPMIAHATCKYGNNFQLLNVSEKGILGWRELPVYFIDRRENGSAFPYSLGGQTVATENDLKPGEVEFVWQGKGEMTPYKSWQVAHFRLLTDSYFLPYGVSYLHKARRSWRMLSMMEDAMLIYRLDRSVERRVFKVYVGGIDAQDVQGYIQQIANNFKRTPVIDPATGQVDLRKNFLDVSTDYFIPVRNENASSPIEPLPAAQNPTSIDDIKLMEDKVLAALRIPKSFLNFQDSAGKGANLSLMDIRFCRLVNRVQQALLTELNKIAAMHLYLLGFHDDISNFSLTLNNPSSQIDSLELDDLAKRIQVASQALADPGTGFPILSAHKVWRDVLKMSDSEILDMLNEIRMEKAMSNELAMTPAIIKKTGFFDKVDRVYGDYEVLNNPELLQQAMQQVNGEGGPGGAIGGGGMMGGLDSLGGMDDGMGDGDLAGAEGVTDMAGAPAADGSAPMNENIKRPILEEKKRAAKSITEAYMNMINKRIKLETNELDENIKLFDRAALLNEEFKETYQNLLNDVDMSDVENEAEEDDDNIELI